MKSCVPKLLCLAIITIAVLLSCGSDQGTPPPSDDWSYLSGNWIGTVKIYRLGDCLIGNSDSSVTDVNLRFFITKEGAVDSIIGDPFYGSFTGSVSNASAIGLTKVVSAVYCFPRTVSDTASYYAIVTGVKDSSLHIDMTATENWCPEANCVYDLVYSMDQFDPYDSPMSE